MPYRVFVADNFHYMDESETYLHGTFDSLELAIAACQRIVDEYLASAHTPGMTADELYGSYSFFGEDPYIVAEDAENPEGPQAPDGTDGTEGILFSAWSYARERCEAMCGPHEEERGPT